LELFGIPGELVVVLRPEGAVETADGLEVTFDAFFSQEVVEECPGFLALALDFHRPVRAEAALERRVIRPDVAAGYASVAGRGAFARHLAVEGDHGSTGARQLESGREAGVAGTHDRDVNLLGGFLGRQVL